MERLSADDHERSLVRELRLVANIANVARDPSWKRTEPGMQAAPTPDPAPEWWGHLQVLEPIGSGAFGTVYRAWDSQLERHVALKLMRPSGISNAFDLARALKEARLLARV